MKNIFKFSEKLRKGSSVATYSNAGVKTEKRVHNRFCTAIGAALLVLCLFILWGGVYLTTNFTPFSASAETTTSEKDTTHLGIYNSETEHKGVTDLATYITNNGYTIDGGKNGLTLYLSDDFYPKQQITVLGTVYLCLNGHTIDAQQGNFLIFNVKFYLGTGYGDFYLYDCVGTGKITNSKQNGVELQQSDFTMYGGTICNNACGVYISEPIYDGVTYGSFTMHGGTISDNHGYEGGGVHVDDDRTGFYMYGGTITGNSAWYGGGVWVGYYSNFVMEGGTISNNEASNDGGGVYLNNSTYDWACSYISGGKITGNKASTFGGGIYIGKSFIEFTISDCEITDNEAGSEGGGVYANEKLTIIDGKINKNTSSSNGGGIFSHSDVTIKGGTICENKSTGEGGGGIFLAASKKLLTIEGGSIHDNSADYGGGIEIYEGSLLIPADSTCEIYKNTATESGGAIFISSSDYYGVEGGTIISGGSIYENHANKNGGGIATSYGSQNLTINAVSIYENDCKKWGGGIYAYCAVTLKGSNIYKNVSTNEGGGIFMNGGSLTIEGVTISENKATNDGGGIGSTDSLDYITINGCKIDKNECGGNGGGIYARCDVTITDGTISNNGNSSNNVYPTNGGGIYLNSGKLTIKGGSISENKATSRGGGIAINDGTLLIPEDSTCIIYKNTAYSGGGIYADENADGITISGGSITYNVSSENGGGIFARCNLEINGGKFEHNESDNGGGVFFQEDDSTFKLNGGNILNNIASENGGGIEVYGGTFIMSDGYIKENIGDENGGGIYIGYGDFRLEGGYIQSNKSTYGTAGIHINTDKKFYMSGGEISGNEGENGGLRVDYCEISGGKIYDNISNDCGGGIYIDSYDYNDSIIYDCEIHDNKAAQGGGIYIKRGKLTLVGGAIYSNSSKEFGGGIMLKRYSVLTMRAKTEEENDKVSGICKIYSNKSKKGAGVFVEGCSTMNFECGEIYSNEATEYGGGIEVTKSDADTELTHPVLNMSSNAKLYLNSAAKEGGGIYVADGEFNMSGGEIYKNSATKGGGIECVSTMNMTGGSIYDNEATSNGGGVYLPIDGEFVIQSEKAHGVKIYGNTADIGGGVYVNYEDKSSKGGSLKIYDGAYITENTDKNGASNVFLKKGAVIEVVGMLSSNTDIGVTVADSKGNAKTNVALTSGYSTYNINSIITTSAFSADRANLIVVANSDGEGILVEKTYNITYTWSEEIEGQVTATYACVQDSSITGTLPATVEQTSLTAATCTVAGSNEYTATVTTDLALANGVERTDTHTYTIAATGHDYSVAFTWADTTPSATLTCAACDTEVTENITVNTTSAVTTAATCTSNGITTYIATASYDGTYYNDTATGVKSVTTDMIDHDYDYEGGKVTTDPTCTDGGYTTYTCKVCAGEVVKDYVNALGHSYKATVTPATCTESGYTTYTCERCGDTYTEDISALGHKINYVAANAATCEEDGNVEYYYCERCNNCFGVKTENDEKVVDYTKILDSIIDKATGHSYVIFDSWTWNEEDFTDDVTATFVCSECDDTITQSATPTVTTVNATCTEDGKTIYLATVTYDGKSYSDTKEVTIAKLDHKNKVEVAAVEATCTTSGNKAYRYCPDCGRTFAAGGVTTEDTTINIPASGHAYRVVFTWNDDGTVATCKAVCANDESHISALTVNMSNKVVAAATCTDEGVKTYTAAATYSGVTYKDSNTKSVAKIAHTFANTRAKAASCTDAGNSEYWSCSTCGKYFTDSEGTQETQLSQTVIAAVGHNPSTDNIKWTWAQDYSSACATLKCATCGKNVIDTATTASEEGDDGTSYTATITIGGQTYTSEAVKPEAKADNNVDSAKTDSATAASSSPMPIAAIITLSGCLVLIVIEALAVIVLFRAIRKE